MSVLTLLKGNTLVAELQNLTNSVSGDYVPDATVTITLVDGAGDPVVGQTWPAPLSYVAGSNGLYRGILSGAMDIAPGVVYDAVIDAVDNEGSTGRWNMPARCNVRR